MTDLKKLRKNQNNLVVTGAAVIMFGLWDVVKTIMNMVLNWAELRDSLLQLDGLEEEYIFLADIILIILLAIFLMLDLGIRFYIGRSANAEGKGNSKGWRYVIITALLLISHILSIINAASTEYSTFMKAYELAAAGLVDESVEVFSNQSDSTSILNTSALIDITSAFIMFEIIRSSVTVKRLTKMLE